MAELVNWIETNPTTAVILSGLLGSVLTVTLPALFKVMTNAYMRRNPPVEIRHQDAFAWYSLFDNEGRTHIVILYSPEIINTGDKLVLIEKIRARYKMNNGKMSSEMNPTTLPHPPIRDLGNGQLKLFPVFYTRFPAMEAYPEELTQNGRLAPFQTQTGFLMFIEDTTDLGAPHVEDKRIIVEIRGYPEGYSHLSCRGKCTELTNDAMEGIVPGITQYQAIRSNLGSIKRYRSVK